MSSSFEIYEDICAYVNKISNGKLSVTIPYNSKVGRNGLPEIDYNLVKHRLMSYYLHDSYSFRRLSQLHFTILMKWNVFGLAEEQPILESLFDYSNRCCPDFPIRLGYIPEVSIRYNTEFERFGLWYKGWIPGSVYIVETLLGDIRMFPFKHVIRIKHRDTIKVIESPNLSELLECYRRFKLQNQHLTIYIYNDCTIELGCGLVDKTVSQTSL